MPCGFRYSCSMAEIPTTRGIRRLDLAAPQELARLANLELVARGVVEGFLIGLHRSPHRGFSVEFAEDRPYGPGDDARFMDWKVYGRTDRLFIKQFEEETNLRAYLLLDVSRSMGWSSDPDRIPSKLDYARLLAASLSLLLVRQGDAAGLLTFDERVQTHIDPRGARTHWRRMVNELAAARVGGQTNAGSALQEIAGRMRRRGLVILVSDLLVDSPTTRTAIRFLRHRGHEVLLFHLLDPGERELPAAGEAIFFDPETGEELEANSATLRREYREAVTRSIDGWRREAAGCGAEYCLVSTDAPLASALLTYLRKRARLS